MPLLYDSELYSKVFDLFFTSTIDIDDLVNDLDGNIESALIEYGNTVIDIAQRPGRWPVDTGFSRDGFIVLYDDETDTDWVLALFNDAHYATYVENEPQFQQVLAQIQLELEFGKFLFRD